MKSRGRVALLSYAYSPSVGGIELVSRVLKEQLTERGWDVRVLTMTPGPPEVGVIREPSAGDLIRELGDATIVLENNPSVRLSWPCLTGLVRAPRMTVVHAPLTPPQRRNARIRDRLKAWQLPKGSTYAVSGFLRSTLPDHARYLPNPYDDALFVRGDDSERSERILFVGRLVPAKGVAVLLRAVSLMNRPVPVTIVGGGPLLGSLAELATDLGIDAAFLGPRRGKELADLMRTHAVLAIPSVSEPPEVFGIVALEGLASGCRLVVSDSGGLPEAAGGFGRVLPESDVRAWADALQAAIDEKATDRWIDARVQTHLSKHHRSSVTDAYESAIREAGGARAGGAQRWAKY